MPVQVTEWISPLLGGLDEGPAGLGGLWGRHDVQFSLAAVALFFDRGVGAAISSVVQPFGLFEVGQHLSPSPAFGAQHLLPFLVVPGAASDVKHAVEHTGAAEGLAVLDVNLAVLVVLASTFLTLSPVRLKKQSKQVRGMEYCILKMHSCKNRFFQLENPGYCLNDLKLPWI